MLATWQPVDRVTVEPMALTAKQWPVATNIFAHADAINLMWRSFLTDLLYAGRFWRFNTFFGHIHVEIADEFDGQQSEEQGEESQKGYRDDLGN